MSAGDDPRAAPGRTARMDSSLTLYSFGPSHFCEKARWALDLCGLPYREVRLAPGPHLLIARRLAPRTFVPILKAGDDSLQGSGEILTWLEHRDQAAWARPEDEAAREEARRLEAEADDGLGVAVRRLAYATGLTSDPAAVAAALFRGVAPVQRACARLMWPTTRRLMISAMDASPADIPAARGAVEAALAALDARLADGRAYLFGERLTRADIAVASLLSPLAPPPQHPVYGDMPLWAGFREIVEPWQGRPCLRWAAGLYREHR